MANNTSGKSRNCNYSDDDAETLMVSHALQARSLVGNWIVDSGATCHMQGSRNRGKGGNCSPNIFSGEANAGFAPPIILTIIYTISMYCCQNAVCVVYIVNV